NLVAGRQRPPSVALPFAGERQVNAQVGLLVSAPPCRRLPKPKARDHSRTGRDLAGGSQLKESRDRGVAHADVIGMDHYDPVSRAEAEFVKDRVMLHSVVFRAIA